MESELKKYKIFIVNGFLLFITVIAGIYINLFTNSEAMSNFWGINLNTLGELWFMLAFGLIAGISLLKAFISLIIIGLIGIFVTFFLYLIYRIYKMILNLVNLSSNLLGLIFLALIELFIAIAILFFYPSENVMNYNSIAKYLIIFFILWLAIMSFKILGEELEKRKTGKIYNSKPINKSMRNKILFTLWIVLLTIIGVAISWQLSTKFAEIADLKYIEIIITTAVFLAGFGLIALDKEDSVFFVNVKQIISWSILSIISAFCYIIFQSSEVWGKMFFRLSAGFLFFTITLVFILVIFHDNKYLKEIEKKRT